MTHRYAETAWLPADPSTVFSFLDDPDNLAAHMSDRSSWRMGGARMEVSTDEQHGQAVGSHIRMNGRVLGVPLGLDEVVTSRYAPAHKEWETVGEPDLLVIGHYRMAVDLLPEGEGTKLTVTIDYDEPTRHRWLGKAFGRMYAHWCVRQMKGDVEAHFAAT